MAISPDTKETKMKSYMDMRYTAPDEVLKKNLEDLVSQMGKMTNEDLAKACNENKREIREIDYMISKIDAIQAELWRRSQTDRRAIKEVENYLDSNVLTAKDLVDLLQKKRDKEKLSAQNKFACKEFNDLVKEVQEVYSASKFDIVKKGITFELFYFVEDSKVVLDSVGSIRTKNKILNKIFETGDFSVRQNGFDNFPEVKKKVKEIEKRISDFGEKVNEFAKKVGVPVSMIWDYFEDNNLVL